MAKVYIGCSGFKYPHWRKGIFYPSNLAQKQEFAYYSSRFNTVELNSTFYRLPKLSVWEKWAQQAPPEFIYAVKMSRFLTHIKKLKNPQSAWEAFEKGVNSLKNHLGPILFQLPPNWKRNEQRLNNLASVLPQDKRFAFEFRDESWFHPSIYKILKTNNWALTTISHPSIPWVEELTADFIYIRLHGKKALYQSAYSADELRAIAAKIVYWQQQNFDVYVYFNNDVGGNAPKNALQLKHLLASPSTLSFN